MEKTDDYCDICDGPENRKFHQKFLKKMKQAGREVREGRTYIMTCEHSPKNSYKKYKTFLVCWECATEQAKKWYKIGKRDGLKKARLKT